MLYAQEHEGRMPPMRRTAEAKAALRACLNDDRIWLRPDAHGEAYRVNPAASGRRLKELSVGTVLVYEPRPYDGKGRVVLFVDQAHGLHGRWLPEAQWRRQMNGSSRLDW